MYACLYDKLIGFRHGIKSFIVHTAYYFGYCLKAVYLVAGIYSLGTVTDFKVRTAFKPRLFFEYRHANILGNAGINGALVYNYRAFCKISADNFARSLYRCKVGGVVVVYGSRHSNNYKPCLLELAFVRRKLDRTILNSLVADFIGRVYAVLVKLYFLCIEVKAYNLNLL